MPAHTSMAIAQTAMIALPATGVSWLDVRAVQDGSSPSRPSAKITRDAVTRMAIDSDSASRITTRSISTLSNLPTYWLARSPIGLADANQTSLLSAALPNPIVAA